MRQLDKASLFQMTACHLVGAKPLSADLSLIGPLDKFQWNSNENSNLFIQENALENVCEMATILSWPQCVKTGKAS